MNRYTILCTNHFPYINVNKPRSFLLWHYHSANTFSANSVFPTAKNCSMKFLRELCSSGVFSTSRQARFRSLSCSSSPPPAEDNIISAAVAVLKYQRSKSRWAYLRSMLTPAATSNPTLLPSQFSQIILQIRNKPHLVLSFFHFTVRHSLCSHSLSSYATTIHTLSRSRFKTEARRLIHQAIRDFPGTDSSLPTPIFEALVKTYRECDSAPFVFDLLISACIESKRIDQSIMIYRMLRGKNIFPNISTCCALIELVVKTQGCFAGFVLYKEIFRFEKECGSGNGGSIRPLAPNANLFNVIMVGFYKDGLVENVEEVWNEMIRVKCAPDQYSYSILMAMYCEAGNMEYAMRAWKEMGDKGMKHDIVAYNTIIGGFCRAAEVWKAEEFYREMVTSGVESTSVTYEHLISGYCKIQDVDSTLLLYKAMRAKGFEPGTSLVHSVIEVLCNKGMVLKALEIFASEMKKHNAFAERRSFVLLVNVLCQEGYMEDALKLQAQMVGKGYKPDEGIYDAFINGYIKQGNKEMEKRLRKEMLAAQLHRSCK